MIKSLFVGICLFALAACGAGVDQDPGTGGSTDPNEVYVGKASDMNSLVYDAANDQLVINNLPFDGVNGRYVNSGQGTVNGTGPIKGFGVYESQSVGETGQFQYFAVFRQTANARAAAAGTGDYADFGHGGAMIGRNSAPGSLPVGRGELVYTGQYAGIRVAEGSGGVGDVGLVSGDATLIVDLLDFDVTGAIVGYVNNRTVYDVNGNSLGTLGGIGINEGSTVSSDGIITGGTVTSYDVGNNAVGSGTFEGLFAGPNGEEIVGAIILTEGTAIQETGVLTVAD